MNNPKIPEFCNLNSDWFMTDNNEKDSAIVQGDDNPLENGQRVVIIYGNDIRVMPYEE